VIHSAALLAPAAPDSRPLRAALERHARRLQLVAGQLDALEAGDAVRFLALAAEREALETEGPGHDDAEAEDAAAESPGVDEVLREALERIDREWAVEREARAGLDTLRDSSLPRVRHLGGSVRVAGSYREIAPRDACFSVRF
jgi:hypothetical protein